MDPSHVGYNVGFTQTIFPYKFIGYIVPSKRLLFCYFRMCVKVLGNDTSLWEDEVYNFAKNHQLRVSTVLQQHGVLNYVQF